MSLSLPVLHDVPAAAEPLAPPLAIGADAIPARFVTLGCKVNQYETQYVRELLAAAGYRDAEEGEPAALAVANTCTVTHAADRKSRYAVRKLVRDNPGVKVVVTGCAAAADAAAAAALPGVVKVIPDKRRLAEELAPFGVTGAVRAIRRFDGHRRAFVKVQDGCMLRCGYCIIPHVRPGLTSRPLPEVVAECRGLIDAGYREIVLTGIHLGHYGVDLTVGEPRARRMRLWKLLDAVGHLPGDFRIRLSSIETPEVSRDLLRTMADLGERVCAHLHPCLQSGSDRILREMNRRYRVGKFLDRLDKIRRRLDTPAFSTDVIVGFPGESDADFADTCRAVRSAGFMRLHVFPFSARQGTPAAERTDAVPPPVVKDRCRRLVELGAELAADHRLSLVGRELSMLVEGHDGGVVTGTAGRYVPLRLTGAAVGRGTLLRVRAVGIEGAAVAVRPVPVAAACR